MKLNLNNKVEKTKKSKIYQKNKITHNIVVKNAHQNNLKNIDIEFPRNQITVVTGVSGSGKSSLAFDTIYAEGQRRFVESLSSYTRQFLERMEKPLVDSITGLPPAVAIEQKQPPRNPRSTVGTITEIYDLLRILFARIGKTICYNCGQVVRKDTPATAIEKISKLQNGSKLYIMFPISPQTKSLKNELQKLRELGFFRAIKRDSNEIEDFESKDIETNLLNEDLFILADRVIYRNDQDTISRITDSIETAFGMGSGRIVIRDIDNSVDYKFSSIYECSDCGILYQEPTPHLFSFNSPMGACQYCQGFGRTIGWDENLIIPDQSKSVAEGAIYLLKSESMANLFVELSNKLKQHNFPLDKPYMQLTQAEIDLLWNGSGKFKGLNGVLKYFEENSHKMHYRILASRYRGYTTCKACGGSRLRTSARQVFIHNMNLPKLLDMPISHLNEFFQHLELTEYENKIVHQVLKEINHRLNLLVKIGLEYLTLSRLSHTLSGGELQRINLATSLGSSLVGTLFVLDEPSIGLHPADTSRLINIIKGMRDIGNTIIVVEHDLDVIQNADYIVELGPHAGENGGEIVFTGTYSELKENRNSLTSDYLNKRKDIKNFIKKKPSSQFIRIFNPRENNLSMDLVEIPINCITVITGVSGSGKSTLVFDVLYNGMKKLRGEPNTKVTKFERIEGMQFFDKIEIIDQSPIGRSSRSTPGTYIKAYDAIRDVFANTQLARQFGLKPGYFSFNVPGGRCEVCEGDGYITVDMQFLANIKLTCEACGGSRFKNEALHFTYKGKTIVDVLNMTIDQAVEFFSDIPQVTRKLFVLQDLGLGYLRLGQPSNVLSGGESQRLKIAEYLDQREKTNNLLIFDEPTTGLHIDDISKLFNSIKKLSNEGNTIVIVEHNLEIIKNADWVIDLGPGAGDKGGKLVFAGTPEQLAKQDTLTGISLKKYLDTF